MIKTCCFILLAALLVALPACQKRTAEQAPEPEPVAEATPEPAPAPAPQVAVETIPMPDPLAAEGVFFLLTKASVMTDDGVIGILPGTQLKRKAPGEYTDAAGHVLPLPDKQVTNNLRLAAQAAQADASAQAAVQRALNQAQAQAARRAPATPVVAAARTAAAPAPQTPQFSATSMSAPAQHAEKAVSSSMAPAGIQNDRRYMDNSGYWHVKDAQGNWQYEK